MKKIKTKKHAHTLTHRYNGKRRPLYGKSQKNLGRVLLMSFVGGWIHTCNFRHLVLGI